MSERPSVAVDSRSTPFITAALGHADSGVIGAAIRVAAVLFVTALTAAAAQIERRRCLLLPCRSRSSRWSSCSAVPCSELALAR